MPTRLVNVVIQAAAPAELAHFWAELLGWSSDSEPPDAVDVHTPKGCGIEEDLIFVPVAEPKAGKNRVHLDLNSTSPEHQEELVERACDLGARHTDIGQGEVPWVVLADPEGNEFCVLEPREEYRDAGALAAIVVHARDPMRQARFWAAATGWTLGHTGGELRPDGGGGPLLEFLPSAGGEWAKNRVHLDVRPYPGDDSADEVARLGELGARPADVGQGEVPWTVLTDPEGNEFCVLRPG